MRAASEGLTLTAANHVLFINEWWNPSTNQQARDRVIRLGQERGVRVYRFMCRDTIEETLDGILHRKEALFGQVVEKLAEPETAEGEVRDLLEAVRPGARPLAREADRHVFVSLRNLGISPQLILDLRPGPTSRRTQGGSGAH